MIKDSIEQNLNPENPFHQANKPNENSLVALGEKADQPPYRLAGNFAASLSRKRMINRFQAQVEKVESQQQLRNSYEPQNSNQKHHESFKRRLKKNRLKKTKNIEQCPVCFVEYDKNLLLQFGPCQHLFCKLCLKQHIQNSLKSFKVVRCLFENCTQILEIQSPHIRALSINQQQKYYKASVFANLSQDPHTKLCPTQDCYGFINTNEKVVACPICEVIFCKDCLMPRHSGDCDENGVDFMQENYKFRKCEKCKMVLERIKGCNHMTCRCEYQFCYVCGGKWQSNHKCRPPPPASNRLSLPSLPVRNLPEPLVHYPPQSPVHINLEMPVPQNQPQPQSTIILNQISIVVVAAPQQPDVNLPPVAAGRQSFENTKQYKIKKILKYIFIGCLTVIFCIISMDFLISFVVAVVLPLLASIGFVFIAIFNAILQMYRNYNCNQVLLGNIFLLSFLTGLEFCRIFPPFYKKYFGHYACCNPRISTIFPMSKMIWRNLDQCIPIMPSR